MYRVVAAVGGRTKTGVSVVGVAAVSGYTRVWYDAVVVVTCRAWRRVPLACKSTPPTQKCSEMQYSSLSYSAVHCIAV